MDCTMATRAARRAPYPELSQAEGDSLPPQGEWTYEDYRRLPDDGWRYEIVRGELHMSPAPDSLHQGCLRNLAVDLGRFLVAQPVGRFFFAPLDVLLPGGLGTPVQPDLIFIAKERLDIVKPRFIQGAPDLVVEILSPSNWIDDRKTKFELYAEAGVREYWIADPRLRTMEIYVLRSGSYELLGRFGAGEQVRSEVLPGFSPAVDEVFAE